MAMNDSTRVALLCLAAALLHSGCAGVFSPMKPGDQGDADGGSVSADAQNPDSQGADIQSPDTQSPDAENDVSATTADAMALDSAGDTSPLPTCPKAKIAALAGRPGPLKLTVIPRTWIKLSGSQSAASNGKPIAAYQWVITTPPTLPKPEKLATDQPDIALQANVAGLYSFCLTVKDSLGVSSCAPTCVNITVVPEAALHIELTWSTPGATKPAAPGKAKGADLDLHFTHPLASGPDLDCDGQPDPWFSNPFDAFWFNPQPAWGEVNTAMDDPVLSRADIDGTGPELLDMPLPEGSLSAPKYYNVGVHAWDSHGFGEAEATVRVFVLGALAVKTPAVKLTQLDMWHVGRIHWPNTTTTAQGKKPPLELCYETGEVCTPAGKPGLGKKWTASGGPCVTACYINDAFQQAKGAKPAGACPTP